MPADPTLMNWTAAAVVALGFLVAAVSAWRYASSSGRFHGQAIPGTLWLGVGLVTVGGGVLVAHALLAIAGQM